MAKLIAVATIVITLFLTDGKEIIKKQLAQGDIAYLKNDMGQLKEYRINEDANKQYINDSLMLLNIYKEYPDLSNN